MGKILGPTLVGLAAAALVAGSFGGQTASAAGASAERDQRGDVVAQALRALDAHPGVARDTVEQEFHVVDTVLDADGSTHVRMTRTVHGLPVIGGDIVVHQGAGGAWKGVSQTLRAPLDLVGAGPLSTRPRPRLARWRPSAATRAIRKLRSAGAPRLVVDAVSRHAPARLGGVRPPAASRTARPAGCSTLRRRRAPGKVLRREEQIHTTDGSGQSLYSGTVSIQVAPSGLGYTLTDPTRGNGQHRRRAEQDRVGPLPAARLRLRQGRRVQQPRHLVRQRHRRAAASRRRSTRTTARRRRTTTSRPSTAATASSATAAA